MLLNILAGLILVIVAVLVWPLTLAALAGLCIAWALGRLGPVF
jgi:hypothetical protein